jgi:hypothetical protein
MNICHVESRGFTSCGMGVGSGPNPVYSPEILFFEAVLRLLLNTKDQNGSTALHQAARSGYEMTAWLLLEQGVDIDAKDGRGETSPGGAHSSPGAPIQVPGVPTRSPESTHSGPGGAHPGA